MSIVGQRNIGLATRVDMNEHTIKFYDQNAESFKDQYLSISTEEVHKSWLNKFLPGSGSVLDVGAGAGRDALYFAKKGLEVYAVEPAHRLSKVGKNTTRDVSVKWINDKLPELQKVISLNKTFDLILISAVWMHIPIKERLLAFQTLSSLVRLNGHLIITLRHGSSCDLREMFEVSIKEIIGLAEDNRLSILHVQKDDDSLKRKDVFWETIVLQKSLIEVN